MSNTPTSNSRTKNQHIIVIREPQILYKLFWLLEPKVKDKTHPSVCAFEFFYLLFWILLPFEFFVFSCCVDWFEMNFRFDFVLEFCDTIWVTSAFFFAFLVAFYCFLLNTYLQLIGLTFSGSSTNPQVWLDIIDSISLLIASNQKGASTNLIASY